jgi:hypothetical protein
MTLEGGLLSIHDRMRRDALVTSLQRMTNDPKIEVIKLRDTGAEARLPSRIPVRRAASVAAREKQRSE